METIQIVVMVFGFAVVAFIGYTVVQQRMGKKEYVFESEDESADDFEHKPKIEFGAEGMNGYKGIILKRKSFDDGTVALDVKDELTGTEFTLQPLVMEYNLINVSGNESLVGRNRFYCNVDFNNRICEWLPYFKNNIKFDLIKDAQKEAKLKENIIKEMEMNNTRKTSPQNNSSYDTGSGYND